MSKDLVVAMNDMYKDLGIEAIVLSAVEMAMQDVMADLEKGVR